MLKRRRRYKPSGGRGRGCLCPDEDIYHPKCCKEDNIWGQYVGQIYADDSES